MRHCWEGEQGIGGAVPSSLGMLMWLWVGAWLVGVAVQIPGVGSIDTSRRLDVTRSLWTSAPPVDPKAYPEFGLKAKDGTIHAWYGVGQSLVMMPADWVAWILDHRMSDPVARRKVQSAVVATLTFPALNATTVVLVAVWLGQLGYCARERISGGLGLLLGTSFLQYGQVHMENSLILFLAMVDAVCLGRWVVERRDRWLVAAMAAMAFSVLVRLPSLADHLVAWCVAVVRLGALERGISLADRFQRLRLGSWVRVALPILVLGFLGDRWYHYHRFGDWSGTYIGLYGDEARSRNPALSPEYPFDGSFSEGFWGPLLSPSRSVFLFDPLLLLLMGIAVAGWKGLGLPVKAAILAGVGAFFAEVIFYAPCVFWAGAASWGNRYTLTPVHEILCLALPVAGRRLLGVAGIRRSYLWCLIAFAAFVQFLSVLMPNPLERAQSELSKTERNSVILRLENVVAKIQGRPVPQGVDPGLWRINLAPATLGSNASGLVRFGLWFGWGVVVLAAGAAFRRSWILASSAPIPGSARGAEV
jgi:hypothetical protein